MNELVQQLTKKQEIEANLRPRPTLEAFKAAIDRSFVQIKFPNTRGGTELGIPLDSQRSDLSGADFNNATGSARIVGELVLDYTRVRFHGKLDLATLKGTGYLEPLDDAPAVRARVAPLRKESSSATGPLGSE